MSGREYGFKSCVGEFELCGPEERVKTEDSLKKRRLGVVRSARRVANICQGGFRLFR